VTRRRDRERCCQACGLKWCGFWLLEELNSQLSSELRACHLGDRTGGVHDPGNATQGELQRFENDYKAHNLIITALGRKVYDRVSHLETTHDVWLKLCNTYEGSSEIKSSRRDTYNRQYQTFSQKPGESLNDCFARFESIVNSLRSCGPLAYSDNERANQLLYALDDSVWSMKIAALEESANFATLDTEKLFSKLKSHELSRKGHPNHDASLTSKALITSACVGGHDANPTNTTITTVMEETFIGRRRRKLD
jgi:hypothetical protein